MKEAIIFTLMLSLFLSCKKEGCISENAENYDSKAKEDDGTCVFKNLNNNNLIGKWRITAYQEEGMSTVNLPVGLGFYGTSYYEFFNNGSYTVYDANNNNIGSSNYTTNVDASAIDDFENFCSINCNTNTAIWFNGEGTPIKEFNSLGTRMEWINDDCTIITLEKI